MQPRWRKVLHDLWDNKAHTLFAMGMTVEATFLVAQELKKTKFLILEHLSD